MAEGEPELAALTRRNRELEEFLEFFPGALLELDLATFHVTWMNRMATILTGYTSEDLGRGLVATDLLDPGEVARVLASHRARSRESITERSPHQRSSAQELHELRLRRRDGSRLVAEGEGSYVLDEAGVPVRLRVSFRDITSRRTAAAAQEKELEDLRVSAARRETPSPLCHRCERVEQPGGVWLPAAEHLRRSGASTGALCPDCTAEGD